MNTTKGKAVACQGGVAWVTVSGSQRRRPGGSQVISYGGGVGLKDDAGSVDLGALRTRSLRVMGHHGCGRETGCPTHR